MTDVRITHIGGPTALIEIDGSRLLTDPTFDPPGEKYEFGWGTSSQKLAGPAIAPEDIRELFRWLPIGEPVALGRLRTPARADRAGAEVDATVVLYPRLMDSDNAETPQAGGQAPDLHFDGLIVDLDGVVWVGAAAVPGSVAAIAQLRARGVRLLFMTNDPRGSRAEYAARLSALGIPADEGEIVTAASALASMIREREGVGTTAFVIGSPSLKADLAHAGLELLDAEAGRDAEIVAVGGHEGFDYDELRVATQALRRGARLYAAGRDGTFPMPDGPWPGTGSIVAAVEVAGGTTAIAVGKPEPFIFDIARSLLVDCRRVAIVGDSLAADIAGGKRAGLTTILVLTGTSGRDDVAGAEVNPDIVLPDLAALTETRP